MVALAACPFGCADVGQTEDCRKFVACVRAIDQSQGATTNVQRFEATGGCWGTAAGTELCDSACRRGLEVLRRTSANRSLAGCQ